MTRVRWFPHILLVLAVVVGIAYAQESRDGAMENKSSKASSDRVVMKVGGVPITQKEFESTIGDIEPKGGDPEKEAEEKDRRRLGDDYASVLMLSQLAAAHHLDSTPDIQQKLAVARIQILSDAQFARLLDQTKASDAELKAYYEAHLSDFDRVRIRRLFIWKMGEGSKNTRGLPPEEAKARAAAILQAPAEEGLKLAERFKGSDQGLFDDTALPFARDQLPGNLDKVVFSLKAGQWGQAEDTPDRVILVYMAARDRQPLSDVSSLVGRLVQGEKMQKQLAELKKKTGIWMDEQYFGKGSAVTAEPGEQRRMSDAPGNSGNQ